MVREQQGRPAARARLDRVPSRTRGTVATHHTLFVEANERRCDLCGTLLAEGSEEGGSGLYLWTRGDEVRFEEPPLCGKCGVDLAMVAGRRWAEEEEEEG